MAPKKKKDNPAKPVQQEPKKVTDEDEDHSDDAAAALQTVDSSAKDPQDALVAPHAKPAGRGTAYVQVHPEDDGTGLPQYVFGDPLKWRPQREQSNGLIYTGWGMPERGLMDRGMMEYKYGFGDWPETPEEQFFGAIRANWQLQQQKTKPLRDSLLKKDFRFRIALVPIDKANEDVYRVFRCSGGMTLRALADKVLLPVMGWVRNYHSWCYIRTSDGAWACPTESDSVDVMHQQLIGLAPFDDREVKVADFFQAKGDSATFIYDFGDRWVHTLKVKEILTTEEGSVQVLGGAGACPPEDSCGLLEGSGNEGYYSSIANRAIDYGEFAMALNYQGRRNLRFDPKYFSLEETRARVTKEIASPASSVSGSKQFQIPLFPKAGESNPLADLFLGRAGKGQKASINPKTFMAETVRDGSVKDPKNTALCLACGNPNNLKLCSACGVVRYCSRECQVADWNNHKATCKKK